MLRHRAELGKSVFDASPSPNPAVSSPSSRHKKFSSPRQVRCMKKFKPSSVCVLCMNFFEFLRSQSSVPAYLLEVDATNSLKKTY